MWNVTFLAVGDAHTNEEDFEKRCSMYNPVRCPVTMALKAMPKESVESMHGYCRGLTGMLGKAAAAKVLAQVFAVQSVEWVMSAQVSPLGSIEHSMVEGYKETVQV